MHNFAPLGSPTTGTAPVDKFEPSQFFVVSIFAHVAPGLPALRAVVFLAIDFQAISEATSTVNVPSSIR